MSKNTIGALLKNVGDSVTIEIQRRDDTPWGPAYMAMSQDWPQYRAIAPTVGEAVDDLYQMVAGTAPLSNWTERILHEYGGQALVEAWDKKVRGEDCRSKRDGISDIPAVLDAYAAVGISATEACAWIAKGVEPADAAVAMRFKKRPRPQSAAR